MSFWRWCDRFFDEIAPDQLKRNQAMWKLRVLSCVDGVGCALDADEFSVFEKGASAGADAIESFGEVLQTTRGFGDADDLDLVHEKGRISGFVGEGEMAKVQDIAGREDWFLFREEINFGIRFASRELEDGKVALFDES